MIRRRRALPFGTPYGDVGPSDGALLIVEPREHRLLSTVIDAFCQRVPSAWVLYVAHGNSNEEFARAAVASVISKKRRVVFIPLRTHNVSANQYNTLFKNPDFWHQIQAEHILVFQTDAVPCTDTSLDIERFGKFGYIGCAYGNKVGAASYWKPNAFYGVGGLSLRKKSFMLDCLKKPSTHHAEDVTFSNCMHTQKQSDRPTAQDVGDFCAQSGWGDPSESPKSWGAHKTELMDPTERQEFLRYCPMAHHIA